MSADSVESSPMNERRTRVFVTGSADGLGRATAKTLIRGGYRVIVHVRAEHRLAAVQDLLAQGAVAVVGDFADLEQTRTVAEQVNALGSVDVVIHTRASTPGRRCSP